jgi:3-oxoacyl-[acyl-carrier-protein] synthase-3
MNIIISGIGSYIPEIAIKNEAFLEKTFFSEDGKQINSDSATIIEKFKSITGIEERRYVTEEQQSSDIGTIAATKAIKDAGIDKETIDGIIFAHNFGNIPNSTVQSDILPSLASRVKFDLQIQNPNCVAFDILFGCPGWIQGVIIARSYILAGEGKRFLVIGSETLSRMLDPYDRDSMIYADGAAASVIESSDNVDNSGILSIASQTHASVEAYYLYFAESHNKEFNRGVRYIKMHGRKIYEFALNNVPNAMKTCLDKSGISIQEIKKVFIHQANEKMDEAIVKRFYQLYDLPIPENIMPMSIHKLGNSSVATVPTLFDLVKNNKLENHHLNKGDIVLLASVGAGMNINAITYRV